MHNQFQCVMFSLLFILPILVSKTKSDVCQTKSDVDFIIWIHKMFNIHVDIKVRIKFLISLEAYTVEYRKFEVLGTTCFISNYQ